MIAVAIDEPLAKVAGGPQVVPVDADGHSQQFLSVALVGQRVALAWRETCTCWAGDGSSINAGPLARCNRCHENNGERMVVGWTAEVEAVVPIVNRDTPAGAMARGPRAIVVSHYLGRGGGVWVHGLGDRSWSLPSGTIDAADWSPGRYALVLRDVWRFGAFAGRNLVTRPSPCRLFSGFAELDEVLA